MSANKSEFDEMSLMEVKLNAADLKSKLAELDKVKYAGKVSEKINTIEFRWNYYFMPERKGQPSQVQALLQSYADNKNDPTAGSALRSYLSELTGYMRDREKLARKQYKGIEEQKAEIKRKYAKSPKKMKSGLKRLEKSKEQIDYVMKSIKGYKIAFKQVGLKYRS
jgi:hypothetical protein